LISRRETYEIKPRRQAASAWLQVNGYCFLCNHEAAPAVAARHLLDAAVPMDALTTALLTFNQRNDSMDDPPGGTGGSGCSFGDDVPPASPPGHDDRYPAGRERSAGRSLPGATLSFGTGQIDNVASGCA
jgi:hypothetical protein